MLSTIFIRRRSMTDNPYETSKTAENPPLPPADNSIGLPTIIFRVVSGIIIILLLAFLLLPNVRFSREAARRMQCSNHLKQIGIALHNYHDVYGSFPPAYTVDAAGKPLHSWRALILPFCEGKPTYDKIDLTKPWDDPANKAAYDSIPPAYRCPSANIPKDKTTYLAVSIPGSCFEPGKPIALTDITDGISNTLLVLDVPDAHAVHWMSPQDATQDLLDQFGPTSTTHHPNGTMAVFVDGHTQFLTKDIPPTTLRALITIATGDTVGDF
jgi:prepilin-type processing-associated H-X9-DG protein